MNQIRMSLWIWRYCLHDIKFILDNLQIVYTLFVYNLCLTVYEYLIFFTFSAISLLVLASITETTNPNEPAPRLSLYSYNSLNLYS